MLIECTGSQGEIDQRVKPCGAVSKCLVFERCLCRASMASKDLVNDLRPWFNWQSLCQEAENRLDAPTILYVSLLRVPSRD